MSLPPIADAITQRRTTRHFDADRPLSDDLLKTILHLATFSPSSSNLQPWRFLVVRSQANREKLRSASFGQPKIGEAPVVVIVLGFHNPHATHLDKVVEEQVRLGVITNEMGHASRARVMRSMENRDSPEVWATRSTMLAASMLMIAAESLGVNSAPMEGFEAAKVKEAFGIPDDHSVCCLVALGYAKEHKPFPGRLGLDEVCYLEHFGQPWTLGDV